MGLDQVHCYKVHNLLSLSLGLEANFSGSLDDFAHIEKIDSAGTKVCLGIPIIITHTATRGSRGRMFLFL